MPRRIHINVVAVLIVVFLALLVIGLASILSPRSAGAATLNSDFWTYVSVHPPDIYGNNVSISYYRQSYVTTTYASVSLNWNVGSYWDVFPAGNPPGTEGATYHVHLYPGNYTLTSVFTEGVNVTIQLSSFNVESNCLSDLVAGEIRYVDSGCTFGGDVSVSNSSYGPWTDFWHGQDGQGAIAHLETNSWVKARGATGVSTRNPFEAAKEMLVDGCGSPTGCDSVVIHNLFTQGWDESTIGKIAYVGNRNQVSFYATYTTTIGFLVCDPNDICIGGLVDIPVGTTTINTRQWSRFAHNPYWVEDLTGLKQWNCDIDVCRPWWHFIYLPAVFR